MLQFFFGKIIILIPIPKLITLIRSYFSITNVKLYLNPLINKKTLIELKIHQKNLDLVAQFLKIINQINFKRKIQNLNAKNIKLYIKIHLFISAINICEIN